MQSILIFFFFWLLNINHNPAVHQKDCYVTVHNAFGLSLFVSYILWTNKETKNMTKRKIKPYFACWLLVNSNSDSLAILKFTVINIQKVLSLKNLWVFVGNVFSAMAVCSFALSTDFYAKHVTCSVGGVYPPQKSVLQRHRTENARIYELNCLLFSWKLRKLST